MVSLLPDIFAKVRCSQLFVGNQLELNPPNTYIFLFTIAPAASAVPTGPEATLLHCNSVNPDVL